MANGNQGSGEKEEGAMHIAVRLVAEAQASELMQPADRALDDPTVTTQAAAVGGAALGEEGSDAFGQETLTKAALS